MQHYKKFHQKILEKKVKKGTFKFLKTEFDELITKVSKLYKVFENDEGEIILLPNNDSSKKRLFGYFIKDKNGIKELLNELDFPAIKIFDNFFARNQKEICSLKKYDVLELDYPHSFRKSEFSKLKFQSERIMDLPKSDHNLLSWIFFVCKHIVEEFGGYWAIRKVRVLNYQHYLPIIIGSENRIWDVGNFCHNLYFKYNKMHGINFESFYKGKIDQVLWKPKIDELVQDKDDLKLL